MPVSQHYCEGHDLLIGIHKYKNCGFQAFEMKIRKRIGVTYANAY